MAKVTKSAKKKSRSIPSKSTISPKKKSLPRAIGMPVIDPVEIDEDSLMDTDMTSFSSQTKRSTKKSRQASDAVPIEESDDEEEEVVPLKPLTGPYAAPWEGIAKSVDTKMSPTQMLKACGLNWTAERHKQHIRVNDKWVPTGYDVLARSDNHHVLTTISEDWIPNQNADAFKFFEEFIEEGEMEMHTAGELKGGEYVFALAKLKGDSFTLFNRDKVEPFLLFTNPHKYGRSIDVRFTAIRFECSNMLTMALQNKNDLAVRLNHKRAFDPDFVKQTLGVAKEQMKQYKERAQFISQKKFDPDLLTEYYIRVFPSLSKRENPKLPRPAKMALSYLDIQPGAQYGRGTWWQAYNSATFVIDHMVGKIKENRLISSLYGTGREKKINALQLALEYAEKS